eukprot:1985879-Ditylum_brightwellii.AAC.1
MAHPCLDWSPYQSLINLQSSLGWNQIHYGRFTKEWGNLQHSYLKMTKLKAPPREAHWLRTVT